MSLPNSKASMRFKKMPPAVRQWLSEGVVPWTILPAVAASILKDLQLLHISCCALTLALVLGLETVANLLGV